MDETRHKRSRGEAGRRLRDLSAVRHDQRPTGDDRPDLRRRQIGRVVQTVVEWGTQGGYFADTDEAETFEAELKAMVARTSGRAWGELPGHLRTEILQMSQGRYRDDYARLIQLYFREIAAGAGRPEP